jgi:hypothetical protein
MSSFSGIRYVVLFFGTRERIAFMVGQGLANIGDRESRADDASGGLLIRELASSELMLFYVKLLVVGSDRH